MQGKSKAATGIRERHGRACAASSGGRCSCKPGPAYEAFVYSVRDGRKIRKTFHGKGAFEAARGWRTDAKKLVRDRKMRADNDDAP